MVVLLSLGSKKIHAMNYHCSGGESRLARAQATPMRHLMSKFRSQWRQLVVKSRQSKGRFGYDPESYSQNFDDGCF